MDDDSVDVPIDEEELLSLVPTFDERRTIVARDGLASVDGFNMSILLVFEYIFGMKVCDKCPDCNHTQI